MLNESKQHGQVYLINMVGEKTQIQTFPKNKSSPFKIWLFACIVFFLCLPSLGLFVLKVGIKDPQYNGTEIGSAL